MLSFSGESSGSLQCRSHWLCFWLVSMPEVIQSFFINMSSHKSFPIFQLNSLSKISRESSSSYSWIIYSTVSWVTITVLTTAGQLQNFDRILQKQWNLWVLFVTSVFLKYWINFYTIVSKREEICLKEQVLKQQSSAAEDGNLPLQCILTYWNTTTIISMYRDQNTVCVAASAW